MSLRKDAVFKEIVGSVVWNQWMEKNCIKMNKMWKDKYLLVLNKGTEKFKGENRKRGYGHCHNRDEVKSS